MSQTLLKQSSKSTKSIKKILFSYGSAILMVGAALILTLPIWTFLKPFAPTLFLVAIMIIAWKDGLQVGVFATALSGLTINYFFTVPEYDLSLNWDDILRLLVFTIEGTFFCWLVDWRKRLAEELTISRENLQALSLRQMNLREEERKRIALEIHDELGQALTGLKMEIHLLEKDFRQHKSGRQRNIQSLSEMVDSTIHSVRRISTELRPPILDDFGLIAAFEWQLESFQKRTGITCVFSTNVDYLRVSNEFAVAVFRILQETLTNVIRHAEARTVSVLLKSIENQLLLKIEDDGKGIRLEEIKNNNSLGLMGMEERARIISGNLSILNGEENGTIIILKAPLDQQT